MLATKKNKQKCGAKNKTKCEIILKILLSNTNNDKLLLFLRFCFDYIYFLVIAAAAAALAIAIIILFLLTAQKRGEQKCINNEALFKKYWANIRKNPPQARRLKNHLFDWDAPLSIYYIFTILVIKRTWLELGA